MSLLTRHALTPVSRRNFLRSSAMIGASAALSPLAWAQVPGANGDVRVAVVGLNGRGKSHISSLLRAKGARIVAICDVDRGVLERNKASFADKGVTVKTFTDLRELVASPEIDAITIATPNHWHSLAAIWALQAGKDVYVEKPVSHNVWEGRQLVGWAAKLKRVVQCGTQIRSGAGLQEAVAWIRGGNLGKVTAARGFCYKSRPSIGKTEGPQPIPAGINYDMWCGPAPMDPLRRKRLHYDWHWVHVTGNGDVGNQGIHQMDVARWFLGETGLPRHTLSVGGRLGYIDDGNTPNTQVVIHDYATAPLIFEVRGLPAKAGGGAAAGGGGGGGDDEGGGGRRSAMDHYRGVSVGNVIDCEGGYLVTKEYFSATAYDKAGKVVKEFKGQDRHMQNFIDVVRSRKTDDLYGPIEEGHVSSALCHLGNISHIVGKATAADEIREKIKGDALLAEATGRMMEHLGANTVDLGKTPLTLGATLTLESPSTPERMKKDQNGERFVGAFAAEANPLLTRQYRAPYVVPGC
jgi:predicted dehydrogenase